MAHTVRKFDLDLNNPVVEQVTAVTLTSHSI